VCKGEIYGSDEVTRVVIPLVTQSAFIRKTPCLLFGAFSTFFMLFMKNVEKAQKSQVLHLPECFSRQSKKYIAFKKSIFPSKVF